ncbi:MAG TPA: TonB-dependent receptor [Blastocatellia bacterium]|nr:TonB-dependent receptor [Blastocatellia bacterium]
MQRKGIPLYLLGLLLLLGAFAFDIRAQAVYGSISGTVTDASGAVVPGATVTITDVDRQTTETVTTNESGLFVKERLLTGRYEVKVEAQGFKQKLISSVVVNLDAQTKVDTQLEAGAISDTVTVTASVGQLLKTDRADVATTFETKQVTDLPILDRNFTKFILLTPGTQQLGWQHAASENPQGSTQIQVNGQHFSGTGYQLDGTENRDPILGIIVINPNFEAIGETKITSQNYDAEFGQAIAGVVSVQTKSGTNEIHGSVFEFRQNDVLQARNPFTQFQADPLTGRAIPPTLRNQFGGAIGGPAIKDKLFWFGDYQGTRSKIGGSRLLTVPTALARTGDLSEYGVNIFDPGTSGTLPQGSRTQFAGNRIPTNRLSPQALAILNLIPLPTRPGIRDNFVASGSEIFDGDTFDVRVDSRTSEKLNIFGRYSFADFTRNGPTAFGAGGGQELVSLGGVSKSRDHSIAAGFDYTLSNTMVLDFRFGFFRYQVNVLPFDFGQSTSSDVGVPGLNLDDSFTSGLFAGFIGGPVGGLNFGSGLGVNRCNCPLDQNEKQFQLVSNLLKTAGNHTFKFGVDVRRAYNLRVPSDQHRAGELSFNEGNTRGPSGGGLGLATFLLGDVTNFQRFISPNTDARERQWRHFYYAQDTWRASRKLTLNYGLRLDVINPQTVNEPGNGGFLDIQTGEIKVAGVGGIPLNGGVENSLNFAPRLGIAYQLNDRLVVRAGYGRSYDIGVFGSLFGHSVTQNLPVLSAQQLSGNDVNSVFNLSQGPPAPIFPVVPDNGRFPLPNGVFTRLLPDKQRLPSVDQYNVTVQYQWTNSVSVEAGYVGNKGTHTFAGDGPTINANQATLAGFIPGVNNQDQRKPFFQKFGWTQGIDYFCNCADNRYDSLQTKINKRFSHGYSVLAHYTWQRAIQDGGDYFIWDQTVSRGPADWDRTHVFVLAQVAELPFGRGRKYLSGISRPVDFALGGWQFNSNTTVQSGLPFTPSYRDCSQERDVGPCRPDLIGDPNTGGDQNSFFNAAPIGSSGSAFARPAVGTFGNVGRNQLRGPGYWRTDASLFKEFRFTESKQLEFRIEVGNLFNHVNLGQPDADIGVPGNLNPNAGRITSSAYGNSDPQRNFQFALKFKF